MSCDDERSERFSLMMTPVEHRPTLHLSLMQDENPNGNHPRLVGRLNHMSLSQRLSPITARLAHILTARKTSRALTERSNAANAPLAIFFGGPVSDIYQVSQWTPVFEKINNELPSVLLVKDARAASALAKLTDLPIRLAGNADAIEPLTDDLGIKAMFYVNNNLANFSVLRIPSVTHIHLSHGESEKISMVSNQLKAYDYCFIAGEASAKRITSTLQHFDSSRLRLIGRPQLDTLLLAKPFPTISGRRTVLYAPTWEGDRAAMQYSSVATAGVRWVTEILQDSSLRLVYRPHPKTGSRSNSSLQADQLVRKLIAEKTKQDPNGGHLIDLQADYQPSLASADVAIFDISAMAMDFSVLQRPYLVTCPHSMNDSMSQSPLWEASRKLVPELEKDIVSRIHEALAKGSLPGSSSFVTEHFGEVESASASERFVNAVLAEI